MSFKFGSGDAADRSTSELPSEVWRWDAKDVADQIRAGTISCSEVAASYLKRISQVNPKLNAIVHLDEERVLRAAKQADETLKRQGAVGPLHGVPVTIKLNVDVKGEATTNGVVANKALIAPEDSAVVTNLRRSGAIILGRTNVPSFSYRWFTENPLYGRTLNVWSDEITSGGSSGGAAVSVAAGMCPLAHGTDIAGSIRYPAYVCGVAGLRPTPGRVPAYSSTVSLRAFGLQTMSAQGPIARSVGDLRLSLKEMAQRDTRDPMWVDARLEYEDDDKPVRVALVDDMDGVVIAPEIRDALVRAAGWLSNAGYFVERVRPPSIVDVAQMWLSCARTEAETGMLAAVEATGDPIIMKSVHDLFGLAKPLDASGYVNLMKTRDVMRREWNELFARFPLVLMPTSCQLPFQWGEDLQGPNRYERMVSEQSPLMATAALSLPGLSVPVGLVNDIPVGVQLVAESFREFRMLAAGEVIERAASMPRSYDRIFDIK
ncbi:amidase [Bradyrhizobium sp. AZCC 2262]|uniref:amidase family protein n=1 Tax=Bradyrhizobium sp. AZCC 2262 TaxID=3117022 RepID=UPI002FF40984